jgi:hypothetical protein
VSALRERQLEPTLRQFELADCRSGDPLLLTSGGADGARWRLRGPHLCLSVCSNRIGLERPELPHVQCTGSDAKRHTTADLLMNTRTSGPKETIGASALRARSMISCTGQVSARRREPPWHTQPTRTCFMLRKPSVDLAQNSSRKGFFSKRTTS